MTMFSDFGFPVVATPTSGIPQYNGGKATAQRQFIVPCVNAQEFGLRAIGKYYLPGVFDDPELPAIFPRGLNSPQLSPITLPKGHVQQQMRLIAESFDIEPLSKCCFNNDSIAIVGGGPEDIESVIDGQRCITSLVSLSDLEKEWAVSATAVDGINRDAPCLCYVRVNYIEQPWDCTNSDFSGMDCVLLPRTAISIQRSSGYDMYTLPNRSLVWADVPAGPDRMLKGDTYAYQIIPRGDITVTWYNVPVKSLCKIENHLSKYRGTVNKDEFTVFSQCTCASQKATETEIMDCAPDAGSESASASEDAVPNAVSEGCGFEAETLMFMDWQEEQSQRTRAFSPMDTTTLTLIFKQKRIPVEVAAGGGGVTKVVGFNHLLCDLDVAGSTTAPWQRVKVKAGGNEEDLFKKTDWTDLLCPTIV